MRRWTKEEIEFLKENYRTLTILEIYKKVNHPISSIHTKAQNLKLRKNNWTNEDIEFLKENYKRLDDIKLAKKLDRTKIAIFSKRRKLKLLRRKSPKKWTKEEIEYSKKNYKNFKYKDFAKKFGRTQNSIGTKFLELNIKKMKNWSDKEINYLKKNYKRLTNRELSKRLGRTIPSIDTTKDRLNLKKPEHYWNNKEIKILKKYYSNKPRKFILNKLKKRSWDSITIKGGILHIRRLYINKRRLYNGSPRKIIVIPKESKKFAWWLGVLAGDGCATENGTILISKDKEFTKKWEKIGIKLFNIKKACCCINKNKYYTVAFNSRNLSKYLGDWKEKVWDRQLYNKFNWILKDKKYIRSFIEGYFDSEGCVSKKKNNVYHIVIAITPKNIKKLIKEMLNKLDINCKIYKGSVYIFRFDDIKSFSRQIYSSIYRKEKILEICRRLKKVPFRYSMNDYNRALNLGKNGMNFSQISKKTGFDKGTIKNWIKLESKPLQKIIEVSNEI